MPLPHIEQQRDKYLRSLRKYTRKLEPAYDQFALRLRRAYRRGGLELLNRMYNAHIRDLVEREQGIIQEAIPGAAESSGKALIKEAKRQYGRKFREALRKQQKGAPPLPILQAAVEPALVEIAITEGAPETVVQNITTLPDRFGYTYSDRIWRNHKKTRAAMNNRLQKYLRDGQTATSLTDELRRFQVNDPSLPRHIRNLERAGRAALTDVPGAKTQFLRELRKAREYAAELAPGPRGTRGFQKQTISQIHKALKEGNAESIDSAIDFFIAKRGKRRAHVLLQSESNRAYQETSIKNYQDNRFVQAVRWKRSPRHKHYDECDLRAEIDIGLGPGVYYKINVPWPAHPLCTCTLIPVVEDFDTLGDRVPPQPLNRQGYDDFVQRIQGPLGKYANRVGRRAEGVSKEKVFKIFKDMVPQKFPSLPDESLAIPKPPITISEPFIPPKPIAQPATPIAPEPILPPEPKARPTDVTREIYKDFEQRNFGQFRPKISIAAEDSLLEYKQQDHLDMNNILRKQTTIKKLGESRYQKMEKQIRDLRTLFEGEEFTLKESVRVYRGAKLSPTKPFPEIEELFERGKDLIGTERIDPGFMSTAVDKKVIAGFTGPVETSWGAKKGWKGIRFEFIAPRGKKAVPANFLLEGAPGADPEAELIFGPGTRYRILDVSYEDSFGEKNAIMNIKAEILP